MFWRTGSDWNGFYVVLPTPSFKRICCACQNVTASTSAPAFENPPTLHPRHRFRLQDRCVSLLPPLVARDDFYPVRSSKVWKPNSLTSSIHISFPASLSSSKSTVTVRTNKSTPAPTPSRLQPLFANLYIFVGGLHVNHTGLYLLTAADSFICLSCVFMSTGLW